MSTATHPTRFASATKTIPPPLRRRSRSADRRFKRRYQFRPLVEPLEDRRMLTHGRVARTLGAPQPEYAGPRSRNDRITGAGRHPLAIIFGCGRT
jgi:hypothetical protein